MRERQRHGSRRPISKFVANSVFLRFSEVPAHTHTVPLPLLWWAWQADGEGDIGTNGCAVGGE